MDDLNVSLDGVSVADGTFAGGIVEDWQPGPSDDAVESSSRIGAASPRFFDLATTGEALTFRVGRQHESYRAARTFERGHRAEIGKVGAVVFSFTEDGVLWQCEYSGAKIGPIQVVANGVFTEATYAVAFAGAPTLTEDAAPVSASAFTRQLIAPNAAGSINVALSASNRFSSVRVNPAGAGGTPYTAKIVLPTTSRQDGDVVEVRLTMPASADPTVEFRNATDSGTTLQTVVNPDATELVWWGKFVFESTAWVRHAFFNLAE